MLAVPVAAPDSIATLRGECDQVICLSQPQPFYAVGACYRDFSPVQDAEIIRLLAEAHASHHRAAGGIRSHSNIF